MVTFAPSGHGLVYVLDNNIYYLEDFSVDVSNPVAVTEIGTKGVVYCGVPDWVYEGDFIFILTLPNIDSSQVVAKYSCEIVHLSVSETLSMEFLA